MTASPADPAAAAQGALELMSRHRVSPSALNYEVWFEYRLGRTPALNAAIEARIAGGGEVDDAFTAQMHEQYFGDAAAAAQIAITGEKIARDLGQVLSFMRVSEEKSGDYGRTLESAATDLNRGLGADQIQNIVSSLAAATLDMANHNQHLTDQLKKSSREINTLRTSLESVRLESLTDALTGLSNRRMFDETLRMRIDEARAQKTELCLLLADIDHFKRFNDTWGHQAGDQPRPREHAPAISANELGSPIQGAAIGGQHRPAG